MQNKKNRKRLAVMASCLAGVMAIGGIMAYFTDADTATNVFTVGKVSLDLIEPNWDPENDDLDGDGLLDAYTITPEFEVQKDPQITNDGVNDEYVFMTVTVPYYNVVTATEVGLVEEDVNGVQVGYEQPLFQFGGNNVSNGATAEKPVSTAGTVLYSTLDTATADQSGHTNPQTLLNGNQSSEVIAAAVNNGWTYMAGTFDLSDTANTKDFVSDTTTSAENGAGIVDRVISHTVTDTENGNAATAAGKGVGVSAQTKNGVKYPVIDTTNHQITYLFAYTGRASDATYIDVAGKGGITLKALKAGETTPTLFDYVKLINITEDQKDITDLEKTAQSIVINAYGIQTANVIDSKGVEDGNNIDGSKDPVTVWNVLAKQSPDTMMAADVLEQDVNWKGEVDQIPDKNTDNKGSEVQDYQKTTGNVNGPNVDPAKIDVAE